MIVQFDCSIQNCCWCNRPQKRRTGTSKTAAAPPGWAAKGAIQVAARPDQVNDAKSDEHTKPCSYSSTEICNKVKTLEIFVFLIVWLFCHPIIQW